MNLREDVGGATGLAHVCVSHIKNHVAETPEAKLVSIRILLQCYAEERFKYIFFPAFFS